MAVRAKFTVVSKTETSSGVEVEMMPVTSGGPENEAFFKWTPHGKLTMGIVNKATADLLEVGQSYYLDFSPALTA